MLYIMEPNAPAYIAFGSSGDVIDDITNDMDQVMKGFPTKLS